MTLGERLRSFRVNKYPSLRKAAEAAGISVAYLSKLESDEAENPTLDVLQKIAQAYEVTIEELTMGTRPASAELNLPKSLVDFVNDFQSRYDELKDKDWLRMLAGIRLRGKYPEDSQDWLLLFLQLKKTLE